jgi:sugar phosphate isomerase/epimerase
VKLGIVLAGVLRRDIEFGELCRFAADNGFGAIDVPPDNLAGAETARKAGLEVASTGGIGTLFVAEAEREKTARDAIQKVEAAANAGIKIVQLGHGRIPDGDDEAILASAKAVLGPVAARAEQLGVKLVYENYAAGGRNFMISPHNWRRVFDAVPSSAVGLCFDPSHLVGLGIDWHRALHEFGSRVHYAHAKDTELYPEDLYQVGYLGPNFGRRDLNGRGWWRFTLPGFGVVDWGRYVGGLREVGYDWVLSVEHEDDAYGFRTDIKRALEGLKVTARYLRPFLD